MQKLGSSRYLQTHPQQDWFNSLESFIPTELNSLMSAFGFLSRLLHTTLLIITLLIITLLSTLIITTSSRISYALLLTLHFLLFLASTSILAFPPFLTLDILFVSFVLFSLVKFSIDSFRNLTNIFINQKHIVGRILFMLLLTQCLYKLRSSRQNLAYAVYGDPSFIFRPLVNSPILSTYSSTLQAIMLILIWSFSIVYVFLDIIIRPRRLFNSTFRTPRRNPFHAQGKTKARNVFSVWGGTSDRKKEDVSSREVRGGHQFKGRQQRWYMKSLLLGWWGLRYFWIEGRYDENWRGAFWTDVLQTSCFGQKQECAYNRMENVNGKLWKIQRPWLRLISAVL